METPPNPKSHWKRWTTTFHTKPFFPKPKYGFSVHLKYIGDFIETNECTEQEYIKFKDAAKFWAWYHGKKVRIQKWRRPNGNCIIRVTLAAHKREL